MNRVLLDQGIPAKSAQLLRDRGWDAVHAGELSMHDSADVDILALAAEQERTVVTLDRDFPQILALSGAALPSILLVRQQGLRAQEMAELIGNAFAQYEQLLGAGSVVTVSRRGLRVRALPFR